MRIEDFSRLVFQLTHSAIELRPDEHQGSQIEILREAIPFDAAWWGWSNFSGGRNRLINTGLFGLPNSFDSAVRAVLHLDPLIKTGRNLAVFGKHIDVATAKLPGEYRNCLEAFNIKSILNGHCRLQGDTQFNFFLSLYKLKSGKIFSADDSEDFRMILRHLEQNLSLSLRAELRSLSPKGGEAAIVSEGGTIVRATRGFQHKLAQKELKPSEIASILLDMSFGRQQWTSANLVLDASAYKPGLVVIRMAPNDILARLSREERRVADLLVQGLTMREISQKRGVSHNTVRNQVTAIYRKIGVRNRAMLLTKIRFD